MQFSRRSEYGVRVMTELAASTVREIELRRTLNTLNAERRRLAGLLDHIPAGVVLRQNPQAGFQIAPGEPISLEVSR